MNEKIHLYPIVTQRSRETIFINKNSLPSNPMSTETKPKAVLTHEVDQHLGRVLGNSYSLHGSLHMLHIIREKIHALHYQPHNRGEIITELERLNYQVTKLHSSMESLYLLLKD